jgi:hypothetical protein
MRYLSARYRRTGRTKIANFADSGLAEINDLGKVLTRITAFRTQVPTAAGAPGKPSLSRLTRSLWGLGNP